MQPAAFMQLILNLIRSWMTNPYSLDGARSRSGESAIWLDDAAR
jgi:hypothetical protein